MTRLSDIQLVLLTSAAQRADGSLLPPSASIADQAARIARAIPSLIKRALVTEADVSVPELAWRQDGDRHVGAFITDAGRAAIGAATEGATDEAASDGVEVTPPPAAEIAPAASPSPKPATKTAMVVSLLQRADGATLEELVTATGWLPHTTRAALTGLRKKGHAIAKGKRGETTCYSLQAAA